MRKIIFIMALLVIGFSNGCASLFADNAIEKKQIRSFIQQVYKEEIKDFVKFQCEERRVEIYQYYDQYFTESTAKKLTDLVESEKSRYQSGAFSEDPRYSDDVRTGDPEDPWMKNDYRNVINIVIQEAQISGDKAEIDVDTLVESKKGQMMRSEYHLIKTKKGWRIDNIIWGPKGEFEERSTQGLRSIY